jgi:cell division protein FtsB
MKSTKLSQIWGFIGLGVVLFLLYQFLLGEQGLLKIYRLHKSYKALVTEVVSLQEENERLHYEIEQLKRAPFQTEKTAREELGLVRPGDVVYKFKQRSLDK